MDRPSRPLGAAGRDLARAGRRARPPGPPGQSGQPAAVAARPKRDTTSAVRIDVERIGERILALNVPADEYSELKTGAAGTIFYLESTGTGSPAAALRLQRYRLSERAASPFLEGIRSYGLSGDHTKLIYQAGDGAATRWGVVSTERPARAGDGLLDVAKVEMRVDPPAEWAQIFRETWRIQRDFFYDAEMHRADWTAIYEGVAPDIEVEYAQPTKAPT